MAELQRPDGTIHYEIHGNGPAVLLLSPGVLNSDHAAWDVYPGVVDLLARDHMVITMDQRYAGLSTGPDSPFSYEAMTGDQLAVLDAQGIDRVTIAGAEIGANYALRLACREPGRVAGAVVVAPLVRYGERPPEGYKLFEETFRVARAEGLHAVVESARTNPRFDDAPAGGPYATRFANDEDFVEETLRKGRERYIVRVVRFRDGMFPADRPLFSVSQDDLAACRVPMLIDASEVPAASDLLLAAPQARPLASPVRDANGWADAIRSLEGDL